MSTKIPHYNLICELIKIIDEIAALLEVQDYYNAMRINCDFTSVLRKLLSPEGGLTADEIALFAQAAQDYMDAQESEDYIKLSDVCILQFRPLCVSVLSNLRGQGIWQELTDFYSVNYAACDAEMKKTLDEIHAEDDSDIPDDYELEETQVGSFAMKIPINMKAENVKIKAGGGSPKGKANIKYSLDSTNNPYRQAKAFVDAYCAKDAAMCVLLGLGMGYNAIALDEREDIVQAEIYEHDAFVIKAAMHYTNLSKIFAGGKVKIIYDPQLKSFAKRLGNLTGTNLLIHYPSLKNIKDARLCDRTEDFFLHYSSVKSQEKTLRGNFIMNTSDEALDNGKVLPAESLLQEFSGKNVLLIAGGPSLDDSIAWLSDMCREYVVTRYAADGVTSLRLDEICGGEEYIVVCVGTVLKRLINEGIIPDYVVMTDAQPNMTAQVAGVDTSGLSLVYLSTLYYKVPQMWKGSKYIAFQNGFEPAQRKALERGAGLFETGGSVAVFALELCLKLKCAGIVCMGLDLAYTKGLRHAGDTEEGSFDGCRMVDAVGGGTIPTAKNLDNYRMWIENRLKRRDASESRIRCINVSCGAVIHGMENILPKDFE